MFAGIAALLALQATQSGSLPEPAIGPTAEVAAASAGSDLYSDCFFRDLSAAEGRDVAASSAPFSKKKALRALRRCQSAKAELGKQIERELAADPAFAEPRLRSVERANRVMIRELTLLLLVRALGR